MKMVIDYLKKNVKRSHIIMFSVGLFLIISGILSWNVYFSKYYIFSQNEVKLHDAVVDYYKYHSVYLPKNKLMKTMTLGELYQKDYIDTLYVPKSTRLCDTEASWVKVYNDNGNYKYYSYLKCGKYETKVDHTGPVITLNGDSTVYVSLNYDYKELGVKQVIDDHDGKIDIKNVTIDSSKVNTKKVGKYTVTYTVSDKLNNETKIKRYVVVSRNLTDLVKLATDDSNYYKGDIDNNYVLFSGMMYRIINVNSDGSVKLISDENLNNLSFNTVEYNNSNVDTYLNTTYLDVIHDKSYLVDFEYCVGNIENREQVNETCNTKIKRKVSLLPYQDYLNTLVNGIGFLRGKYNYALANRIGESILVAGGNSNSTSLFDKNVLPPIRPVITLKSNLTVLAGEGTKENPYKLDDYKYAKQQDKINTRLVGEYVNYSGTIFRIIGVDKNKNVKMISLGGLEKKIIDENKKELLVFDVPIVDDYYFNIKDTNNPGYIINNKFIDYIKDDSLVSTSYSIPIHDNTKSVNEYVKKDSGKAKIVMSKTYDLFSAVQIENNANMYLYLDSSTTKNNIYYLNAINGLMFEASNNIFGGYSFKSIVTVKGDLVIRKGKGILNNPYYLY